MICNNCGNLIQDCECEDQIDDFIDYGDDERVWGYDGDAL